MESSTSAAACDVVRVGITGASGRLGALLVRELGGAAAPLQLSGGDETAAGGSDRVVVTIVVPFTFDVADYEPWAGTAGAGGGLFASAVAVEEEQAAAEAAAVQAAEAGLSAAQIVRRPHQLDLGDAAAVAGAFAGLDIVVHLAATIHADAAWDTVSRNNVNATQHVMAECAASGVRRLVFASTNHTQAAEFFTSLDPAVEGGMCALRSEQLHAERPLTTLQSPSAPDGFYACVCLAWSKHATSMATLRHMPTLPPVVCSQAVEAVGRRDVQILFDAPRPGDRLPADRLVQRRPPGNPRGAAG
jgi:hypothetical protein